MAESGKNEEGRSDDRGGCCLRPSREPPNTDPCSSPAVVAGCTPSATERRLPQNIVIQLTGTEGEWHSPEDSELIFSPEPEEDCPLISLSREDEVPEEGKQELVSTTFHVPLSPSSPCSLGSCSSMAGPSFLSPGPPSPIHRPLASLVKSISTELELKEGSTLRPRPLLSLVKSISTEMSRSEPEVSPSKSDSRLNLHLLKQLSPHKGRGGGDSRTVPASPISLSPGWEGPRGGFFKMELEDTKRKLSEAMQEPLSSMFSKLMREESAGSPKHQCRTQGVFQGWEGSMEAGASESPVRSAKRPDADVLPGFNGPCVRHPGRGHHSACPVPHGKPNNRDEELEIYADGDMMQVVALESHKQSARSPASSLLSFRPLTRNSPPTPIPCTSLLCVAMLSFLYFTLPLSPYMSGVALGLAMGFMLGLFLISLGSSRYHSPANASRYKAALLGHGTGNIATNKPDVLKGWMNEIHEYDPETFHPSLTASVFATLEGSCLRLDSPRSNISRRAAYDERHHNATFIKSRSFQLGNSKVFLLPSALASKRVWNPKYPICIRLAEGVTPVGEQAIDGAEEESQREEEPDVELEAQRQRGGGVSRPQPHLLPTTLHLFGRTGREKEEWFHHFTFASLTGTGGEGDGETASRLGDLPTLQSLSPSGQAECGCGSSRAGAAEDEAPSSSPSVQSIPSARVDQTSGGTRCTSLLDYPSFMTHLLAMEQLSPLASPAASSTESSPTLKCTCDLPEYPRMEETAWANALIGRIFWDFLREKYWSDVVSRKIQKKLSKIRLPYFMNDLTLTELDMGSCMPKITAASRPEVNYRGLWVELDVAYTGALQMTLQTKFNLSKLGKEGGQEPYCSDMGVQGCRPILSVLADSDEESSSAGSSDEEEVLLSEPQGAVGDRGAPLVNEGAAGGRTGKKILRFFDKIAKSKYFQKATENEFIRKKIEEMSNTPLLLTVEVKELSGTMVVNIPPPPSDRIWYSFCIPPKLDLRVRPKLGEREVTFCHVTEWIEKKLQQEFQQVFVLPNMDDIYLPLMHSGRSSPPLSHNLSSQSLRSQSSSVESIERIPAEVTGT